MLLPACIADGAVGGGCIRGDGEGFEGRRGWDTSPSPRIHPPNAPLGGADSLAAPPSGRWGLLGELERLVALHIWVLQGWDLLA